MADTKIKAILSEVDKVDSDFDVILPGAFDDAIEGKMEPNMLYMHRRGEIVGKWSSLRMDGKLLKAEGVLYTGDEGFDLAKRTVKLIKTGQMDGVSIGFRPVQWKNVSTPERPYGWDIESLDLKEASIVDFPANDSAEVTDLKRKFDDKESEDADRGSVVIQKFYSGTIEIVLEKEEKEPEVDDDFSSKVTKFAEDIKQTTIKYVPALQGLLKKPSKSLSD